MQSNLSLASQALKEFEQMARRYLLFHASFLTLFALELFTLLALMLFFSKTLWAAIAVASLFLTVFVYFVLRFYLETRKQERLSLLRDRFLEAVDAAAERTGKTWAPEMIYPIYQWIQKLQGKEALEAPLSLMLRPFEPLIEKFVLWCRFDDVHWMKETLHQHALKRLLNWVKLYPTDVELHKTVAGAYMALYQIYRKPSSITSYSFIERRYESIETKERFRRAACSALEEFKVVLNYLSEDAWSLCQMAHIYRDLGAKEEEKKAYETLLDIKPNDPEIHYQLGKLYFELGQMAKGLHLYHELQNRQDPKASELIQHYDAYHNAEG